MEKKYSKSNLIPAARLKRALCLEQQGNMQGGHAVLESLVNDYPNSPEAFTAEEKLKASNKNEK